MLLRFALLNKKIGINNKIDINNGTDINNGININNMTDTNTEEEIIKSFNDINQLKTYIKILSITNNL